MSNDTQGSIFDAERIGASISRLRKKAGYTQSSLADALDVSFQAVSNWERGKSTPDIAKLYELSALLNASIDEIMGNTRVTEIVSSLNENRKAENVTAKEIGELAPILTPENADRLVDGMELDRENIKNIESVIPSLSEQKADELCEAIVEKAMEDENGDCFRESESENTESAPEQAGEPDNNTEGDKMKEINTDELNEHRKNMWEKINSQIDSMKAEETTATTDEIPAEAAEEAPAAAQTDEIPAVTPAADTSAVATVEETPAEVPAETALITADAEVPSETASDSAAENSEASAAEEKAQTGSDSIRNDAKKIFDYAAGEISRAKSEIEKSISDLNLKDNIREAISQTGTELEKAKGTLKDAGAEVSAAIGTAGEGIKKSIPEVKNDIKSAFSDLASEITGEKVPEKTEKVSLTDNKTEQSSEETSSNRYWKAIESFLPFMSREAVDDIAAKAQEKLKKLPSKFLPFMSRNAVDSLAQQAADKGEDISSYLPFMSKEKLGSILKQSAGKGSIGMDTLRKAVPFASKDAIDDAASVLNEGDEDIASLLPFMSKEKIDSIMLSLASKDEPDADKIKMMLPFASRDAADSAAELVVKKDAEKVISFAPFMSRAAVGRIMNEMAEKEQLDTNLLRKLMPFASAEDVNSTADKVVYRFPDELIHMMPFMTKEKIDEIASKLDETNPDNCEDAKADATFIKALELAADSGVISVSLLVHEIGISFIEADTIVQKMYRLGYVSDSVAYRPRRVYITREQIENIYGGNKE